MAAGNFEEEYVKFLEKQKRQARGMRLEMLNRDLTGTKKLLEVLWHVFGSFEHLELEFELVGTNGIKIYADVFHRLLKIVFEAHGYVAHAEKVTRERFSFEQMRVRSFITSGYKYVPFSWDELEKKPEICIRALYEILGRFGNAGSDGWMALSVYERETIRCAMVHGGTFSMKDASAWLQLGPEPTRQVLRKLANKALVELEGGSMRRFHRLRLSSTAIHLL